MNFMAQAKDRIAQAKARDAKDDKADDLRDKKRYDSIKDRARAKATIHRNRGIGEDVDEAISLKDLSKSISKAGGHTKIRKVMGADKIKKDLEKLRLNLKQPLKADVDPQELDNKQLASMGRKGGTLSNMGTHARAELDRRKIAKKHDQQQEPQENYKLKLINKMKKASPAAKKALEAPSRVDQKPVKEQKSIEEISFRKKAPKSDTDLPDGHQTGVTSKMTHDHARGKNLSPNYMKNRDFSQLGKKQKPSLLSRVKNILSKKKKPEVRKPPGTYKWSENVVENLVVEDAEYQGKKVKLNSPIRSSENPNKKFKVYVKNDSGKVVVVRFGDPKMDIKRDDPERRKSFRARHGCDNPGPKWKAKYWSCYQWRSNASVES